MDIANAPTSDSAAAAPALTEMYGHAYRKAHESAGDRASRSSSTRTRAGRSSARTPRATSPHPGPGGPSTGWDANGPPAEPRTSAAVLAGTLSPWRTPLGALLTLEQARPVTAQLRSYVDELIDRERRQPEDDVLTELVRRSDGGELDDEQVLHFGLSMVLAGHRTTTMFLANAVLLLQRPAALSRLRAAPETVPAVVDELLRHLPIMNGSVVLRATTDFELRGCPSRRGGVADHPGSQPRSERFRRPGAVRSAADGQPALGVRPRTAHLAGISLARAELRIVLEAMLARFPSLSLAVDEDRTRWEESPAKSPLALPLW